MFSHAPIIKSLNPSLVFHRYITAAATAPMAAAISPTGPVNTDMIFDTSPKPDTNFLN